MPRRAEGDIEDLADYGGLTVTSRQAAHYLGVGMREVHALVRCGLLKIQARGTREYHIFTASLRTFDDLRFKRSA